MDDSDQRGTGKGLAATVARLPTGAKVFLILVGALLPLALIAMFTAFQTTQRSDDEARSRLRIAADESTGVLATVLTNNVAQFRDALSALERDADDTPVCSQVEGTFAAQAQGGTRFAISDGRGRLWCGERFRVAGTVILRPGQVSATLLDDGLTLRIGGNAGASATAFYPVAALRALVRPSGFVPDYGATLVHRDERLTLQRLQDVGPLDRLQPIRGELGTDDLALEMAMPGTPITSPLIIATVLLVLMWIAAAAIGWFVVDGLLIRPLRRLRASVGNYKPGEVIDPAHFGAMPAQEIRELGDTFREISKTVRLHEADLAEGLVRQTRLTREVHHRVKNNLQVIASLINFHARGASSAEATEAYASIQRRVDALAVVHRHHYAELEENRGLELRSVLGELASNIRATAPERAAGLGITLDIEPFLVSQDIAVAVAFLITEIVELATSRSAAAQIRISVKPGDDAERAVVRVSSPALVESSELESLLENRYGRVMAGLARQLRTKLHYDPLVGAYEASIAVSGRS